MGEETDEVPLMYLHQVSGMWVRYNEVGCHHDNVPIAEPPDPLAS